MDYAFVSGDRQALGFGLVCPHRLRPEIRDIGNHVRPEHRRKGVGRSVMSYLSLASAGYLAVTRNFSVAL